MSVERIHETAKLAPMEGPWRYPGEADPNDSLANAKYLFHNGDVKVENLSLSYAPGLGPVLKNITLDIK